MNISPVVHFVVVVMDELVPKGIEVLSEFPLPVDANGEPCRSLLAFEWKQTSGRRKDGSYMYFYKEDPAVRLLVCGRRCLVYERNEVKAVARHKSEDRKRRLRAIQLDALVFGAVVRTTGLALHGAAPSAVP